MTCDKNSSRETPSTPLLPDEFAILIGQNGKTMEGEINRAMDLLAARGVAYPVGYSEILIQKYQKTRILWPVMLMSVGCPHIRRHVHYQDVLQNPGNLLDYGCGTGDDLRALVADGYPQQQVCGFDINWF